MFHEPAQFDFTQTLETNWRLIRQECEEVLSKNWIVWPEPKIGGGGGWTAFGLFLHGRRHEANCALCPETARLAQSIPGMTMAGFSSLAPGVRLRPHTGYSNRVLRCHLGLIVPDSCGLRVGEETRQWEEGKCLVFDDTYEHSAWNDSEKTRIVLLVDFLKEGKNPDRSLPASVVLAMQQSTRETR